MGKTIFKVDGGIGRELWFTGLLKKYKETYPDEDIIVYGGIREVFDNLPFIHRFYNMGSSYFYDDVMLNADNYFEFEPYNDIRYWKAKTHAIEIMNEDLFKDNEIPSPIINLNDIEDQIAQKFIKDKHEQKKKIALFQAYGASGSNNKPDPSNRSLTLKEIEEIHSHLVQEGYEVFYIGKDVSQAYKDGMMFKDLSLRQIFSMIKYADLLIGIDSFMATAAAAFDQSQIVIYKATLPENVGFKSNINVVSENILPMPNRIAHGIQSPEQRNANNTVDIKLIKELITKWGKKEKTQN